MKHSLILVGFLVFCSSILCSVNARISFDRAKGNMKESFFLDTIPSLKKKLESSDCVENINLNNTESNVSYLYWASNKIVASNNYKINAGADIRMKAGKSIVLKPNVKVLAGSKYLAKIENCKKMCGESVVYPKFFTPNGDGYNDYWKIENIENLANANVMIYDRFGKLLKNLGSSGKGWDGIFTSSPLFSTDYWFVLTYIDCDGKFKEIKSHFTLKR